MDPTGKVGSYLVLMLMLSLAAGCGHFVYPSGPYNGRVVDVDSDEPIAGAAVVAIWIRERPAVADLAEDDWDVYETLSDVDGEFTIPHRTHFTPFGWILEPALTVYYPSYAPGYAGFFSRDVPLADRPPRDPRDRNRPKNYATIALKHLTTREERVRKADLPVGTLRLRWEQAPNLMRLINDERRQLGLRPLTRPGSQP